MKINKLESKFTNWLLEKGDVQIIAALVVLCVLCAILSATVLHGGKFEGSILMLSVFFGGAAAVCTTVISFDKYFENNNQE